MIPRYDCTAPEVTSLLGAERLAVSMPAATMAASTCARVRV